MVMRDIHCGWNPRLPKTGFCRYSLREPTVPNRITESPRSNRGQPLPAGSRPAILHPADFRCTMRSHIPVASLPKSLCILLSQISPAMGMMMIFAPLNTVVGPATAQLCHCVANVDWLSQL